MEKHKSTKFEDLTPEQQDFIVKWVNDNFVKTKNVNYSYSAYGLKQKFSRLYFYVSTDQFVEAMIRAGFSFKEKEPGIVCFNIGKSSPFFSLKQTDE